MTWTIYILSSKLFSFQKDSSLRIFFIFFSISVCIFLQADILTPKLAKSEGFLWSLFFCIFYFLIKEDLKKSFPYIAYLSLLSLSVKITSIHALIALALTLIFGKNFLLNLSTLKQKKLLIFFGAVPFILIGVFRLKNHGTPLFPADISLFSSFMGYEYHLALKYFKTVAFPYGRSLSFDSFFGFFYLLRSNIILLVALITNLIIIFILKISFKIEEKRIFYFILIFH